MKSRDESTGLPSRNSFLLALELGATDARQRLDALSLLSLMIAPASADPPAAPIAALAKVVLLAIGGTGLVASAGPDRLFVMLKGRDLVQARDVADRLSGVLKRHFEHRVQEFVVSIGAACAPAGEDWATQDLVALAEGRAAAAQRADRDHRVESAWPNCLASPGGLAHWPSLPALTTGAPPRTGEQLELF
jgi:hypothetical protein